MTEIPIRSRVASRDLRLLVLAVAVLFVLWLARGVIAPFVVAAILAYAFSPLVSAAEDRTRLPRLLIVVIGYVIAVALIAVAVFFVWHRASTEVRELSAGGQDIVASALHRFLGNSVSFAGQTVSVDEISRIIHGSALGAFSTPTDAIHMAERTVDIALQAVLTLIIAFYLLLDGDRFIHFTLGFFEPTRRARVMQIGHRIHLVLGRWLRGQLFLIALVSVVLYVLLGPILGVPYSLALAIMSGVLEIIPLVGPIVAAAIAVTVAFAGGGTNQAIVVLVIYVVVRQVEDQIVMPIVIGRAVHLHPVITIFAVLVGLSSWGILGGLLGVPVAAALNVTLHELYPEETSPQGASSRSPGATIAAIAPPAPGDGPVNAGNAGSIDATDRP